MFTVHRHAPAGGSSSPAVAARRRFIDDLPWQAELGLRAYGVKVGIRVDDEKVLDQVREYLPYGWRPIASTEVDRIYSILSQEGRTNQGSTIRLAGRAAVLAGTDEWFLAALPNTPRAILESLAAGSPGLAECLLRNDGQPRSSTFFTFAGRLITDLDQELPELRPPRCQLYRGDLALARSDSLSELLEVLESDLDLYIARWARRRVFVHAGVAGWRGRAMLFPGRSLSGKTTLISALVDAGATYYSDEYAVLDDNGLVHPYLRPLSLRREAGSSGSRQNFEIPRSRCGTKPLPAGLVVLTRYCERTPWLPRRLSPGEAMLGLLANTVAVRQRPRAALHAVRRVSARAVALQGQRGEARDLAPLLLDSMSQG